jgi:hypothetical protein
MNSRVAAFIRKGTNKPDQSTQAVKIAAAFDCMRARERKWRNLVNEAKFDIPDFFWEYVDWKMPAEWSVRDQFFVKIQKYKFYVRLPGFLPVAVHYENVYNAWEFSSFEVDCAGQVVSSNKYHDLACMLALAGEKSPKRNKVAIEEISGEMTDGTVLKPLKLPVHIPFEVDENTSPEIDWTGYGLA